MTSIGPVPPVNTAIAGAMEAVRLDGAAAAESPARAGFADALSQALESIATRQKDAEAKVAEFASGNTDDVAGMLVAINKAGLSLQLGLEVRNRVMDAYHEVMRMQV
jgi:flagellar hook-basal body complex protein FliE